MKRTMMCVALAALSTIATSAQDWAKARIEKSPRHLEWLKIKSGGREVNCSIAYPDANDANKKAREEAWRRWLGLLKTS